MTRLKISIFIILLLTGTSIFSGAWIDKNCTSLMELSSYALVIEFAKIGLGIGFIAEEKSLPKIKDLWENRQLTFL